MSQLTQLTQLIQQIPEWQQLNPEELWGKLREKTIHYIDKKLYRLYDIAKLIGDENMGTFLNVIKDSGRDWMISEAASGVPLGDEPVNTRLRKLNHPAATSLADHTNRMISVLEQHNITTTQEEVAQVQASMKLNLYKQSKIDKKQDQLQAYREAMSIWNGASPEPEF